MRGIYEDKNSGYPFLIILFVFSTKVKASNVSEEVILSKDTKNKALLDVEEILSIQPYYSFAFGISGGYSFISGDFSKKMTSAPFYKLFFNYIFS